MQAFTSTMDSQALDALIYPTFVNSPTLLGDGISPSGGQASDRIPKFTPPPLPPDVESFYPPAFM